MARSASQNAKLLKAKGAARKKAKSASAKAKEDAAAKKIADAKKKADAKKIADAAKKPEVKKAVVEKSTTTSGKVGTIPKNAPDKTTTKTMTHRVNSTPDGKTDHGKSVGFFGKPNKDTLIDVIDANQALLKSYGRGTGRLGDKY